MPEYLKIIVFIIAGIVSIYGYINYGRRIHSKSLRPRTFTWLIWGILSTCVAVVQIQHGAALGSVGAVLGAASGYILAGMAWYYGHRKIYGVDIASLILAGVTLVMWWLFGGAWAVLAASLVYLVGFIPTIVRAWKAPDHESRVPFVTSAFKHGASLAILGSFSFETVFYPVVLTLANVFFVILLVIRRRQ